MVDAVDLKMAVSKVYVLYGHEADTTTVFAAYTSYIAAYRRACSMTWQNALWLWEDVPAYYGDEPISRWMLEAKAHAEECAETAKQFQGSELQFAELHWTLVQHCATIRIEGQFNKKFRVEKVILHV